MGMVAGTVACAESSLFGLLDIMMMDNKACLMGQKNRRQIVNTA